MRPIDADALIQFFQSSKNQKAFYTYFTTTDIIRVLDNAPTFALDDFGIVRCKDCKYWQDNNEGYPHPECRWGRGETPDPDDYCSFGAKIGGGE